LKNISAEKVALKSEVVINIADFDLCPSIVFHTLKVS